MTTDCVRGRIRQIDLDGRTGRIQTVAGETVHFIWPIRKFDNEDWRRVLQSRDPLRFYGEWFGATFVLSYIRESVAVVENGKSKWT